MTKFIPEKDSFIKAGVIWYPKGVIDDAEIALWYLNDKVLKAIRFDELKSKKDKVPSYESSWMNIVVSPGLAEMYDKKVT
ncbi:MAG: hypothetical protein IPL95_02145 [Saprospiraceae bacterium]|nr:hypothetical protein [Saprospiraceae bacterium]